MDVAGIGSRPLKLVNSTLGVGHHQLVKVQKTPHCIGYLFVGDPSNFDNSLKLTIAQLKSIDMPAISLSWINIDMICRPNNDIKILSCTCYQ